MGFSGPARLGLSSENEPVLPYLRWARRAGGFPAAGLGGDPSLAARGPVSCSYYTTLAVGTSRRRLPAAGLGGDLSPPPAVPAFCGYYTIPYLRWARRAGGFPAAGLGGDPSLAARGPVSCSYYTTLAVGTSRRRLPAAGLGGDLSPPPAVPAFCGYYTIEGQTYEDR